MQSFLAACAAELGLPDAEARAFAGAMLLRIGRELPFAQYVHLLTSVPDAIPLVLEARRRGGWLDPLNPLRRQRLLELFHAEVRRHAGPLPPMTRRPGGDESFPLTLSEDVT